MLVRFQVNLAIAIIIVIIVSNLGEYYGGSDTYVSLTKIINPIKGDKLNTNFNFVIYNIAIHSYYYHKAVLCIYVATLNFWKAYQIIQVK